MWSKSSGFRSCHQHVSLLHTGISGSGRKITIQDFGTLSVKQQKKRERFNLATHQVETYLPYEYIKFTASKSVRLKQKEKAEKKG